jgi:predicted transcriptional regulator of viral defense system
MVNCIKKRESSMVMKTETLYDSLLPLKVVTFDDIVQQALPIIEATPNRRYIYKKYVTRLVQTGKLHNIRKNLYLVLSPLEKPETYMPDKILIAAKIKKQYYLGYHTALEYYGCAQSLWNEAYVVVKPNSRFDIFHYKRYYFKPVFNDDITTEIQEKHYQRNTINVSSKERTLLDCLSKPQYVGGWEETIKSLEGLGQISIEKTLKLLHIYKDNTLTRKTGYVLELLRDRSPFYQHINDENLKQIQQLVTGLPRYLISKEKGRLNTKWNLYVPEDFEDRMRGI